MKILFTSAGRRVELIQMFRAAAEKLNKELVLYGADMDISAPALSFCDGKLQVPRIRCKEYLPSLVAFCKENSVDLLIPTIDTDLLLLAENRAMFEAVHTRVLISAPKKIAICRDKCATAQYFQSLGLCSPMPVEQVKDYQGGFPAFIKPKDGSASKNAYRADTWEELEVYAEQIPNYIIQPFASGTEYTVDIFCDFEGNPIYITPRVRLSVRAGEVLKTQIRQDESIIAEMKQMIADYKPCGPITVQLIQNSITGENWYIEINPRFGGGAPLSMKAGANSAEAILRILDGEKVSYCESAAENGAMFCRFDQSIRVN